MLLEKRGINYGYEVVQEDSYINVVGKSASVTFKRPLKLPETFPRHEDALELTMGEESDGFAVYISHFLYVASSSDITFTNGDSAPDNGPKF